MGQIAHPSIAPILSDDADYRYCFTEGTAGCELAFRAFELSIVALCTHLVALAISLVCACSQSCLCRGLYHCAPTQVYGSTALSNCNASLQCLAVGPGEASPKAFEKYECEKQSREHVPGGGRARESTKMHEGLSFPLLLFAGT